MPWLSLSGVFGNGKQAKPRMYADIFRERSGSRHRMDRLKTMADGIGDNIGVHARTSAVQILLLLPVGL
jgi:hypothetical protein